MARLAGRPLKRIQTCKAAAQALGCSTRTLQLWEKEDWWKPSFRTAAGYDVTSILRARTDRVMPGTDLGDSRNKLRLALEKSQYDLKQAELRSALREEQLELGNVLPLDVWSEFAREFLGLVRQSLDQLPMQMRREASPDQIPLVWTDGGDSPLQRRIAKIIGDVESWLSEGPDGITD